MPGERCGTRQLPRGTRQAVQRSAVQRSRRTSEGEGEGRRGEGWRRLRGPSWRGSPFACLSFPSPTPFCFPRPTLPYLGPLRVDDVSTCPIDLWVWTCRFGTQKRANVVMLTPSCLRYTNDAPSSPSSAAPVFHHLKPGPNPLNTPDSIIHRHGRGRRSRSQGNKALVTRGKRLTVRKRPRHGSCSRTGIVRSAAAYIMGRVERRGSLSSGSDDDEDDEKCPLCCEDLDVTDRNFFPCPCGYQVRGLAV